MTKCNTEGCKKGKCSTCKIIAIAAVMIVIVCAVIYVADYYHADQASIQVYTEEYNEVTVENHAKDITAYIPQDPTAGFIFYPGGKVEASSYEPLMTALADRGILSILVEMPGNLAVLDVKAADGLQEMYPQVELWYIGGHSLGGSMAASYAADRADILEGVILLGSYSTADLKSADLDVLSIYGSEDKVMNKMKYQENLTNLPDDYKEIIIDGGCHASFGMYGEQDGDGEPTITSEEQIEITAEEIAAWISTKQ